MLFSFRWLQELCPIDADVAEVAHRISLAGLEVEAMDEKGGNLSGVVIAEVRAKSPHPKKDKLTLVTVFDGEDEHEVVCGAPNVPEPGGRILFARSGAVLPNGIEIAPRKVGGVESNGMICSEAELEIGTDAEGIFVVDSDTGALPGTSVADALDLHDVILDIGLTPNRPDCLGHVGIAREIGVLFGVGYTPRKAAGPQRTFADGGSFQSAQPTSKLTPLWDNERPAVRRRPRVGCQSSSIAILASLPAAQSRPSLPVERRRRDQSDSSRVGPSDSWLRPREAGRIESRRSPRVRGREDGDARWRRTYLHH
jgi:phenylalanyl-tRNA synthetase beta chain